MTKQALAPKVGDMYRCSQCGLELHVTKGCDCSEECAELNCCGQSLEKVTEPAVTDT